MAKLKHTFVRGRMNKDIDERMLPNGEYRDALNIQVATSEGSNVGAIENILGNTKKNIKAGATEWNPGFGLTNPVCIGGIRDAQNDKIYWFVTSDSVDAILEYDKDTNIVAPVLVDTQGVLNFSVDYLITGINILDGLLYWTDDLNEPKVINIATFKAGSDQGANTDLSAHTQVYGRNFIEKDTTVITEVPPAALSAVADPSLVGGAGTGITPIVTNDNPGTAFAGANVGDVRQVSWSSSGSFITWAAGSRAVFTTEVEQEDGSIDKYQVIGEFVNGITNANNGFVTIESRTPNIPTTPLAWEMLLIEDDPIFKDDFPRFSYRYKFTDGRYSTYAPFTLPAFVPGKFKYLSRDGNNEGMNSVIRKITISNFPSTPDNVAEIEILYKGAASNNIYVVETFDQNTLPATFEITSGLLGGVVEGNQILRLFDNVPRAAKSQEIISNRIVYGNYLQNYDVDASNVTVEANVFTTSHSNIGFGTRSIKTSREYQLGVAFVDDYGRESPIFTSKEGAVKFDIKNSKNINSIEAVLPTASVPSWASYFKYYIKNNTPDYYNLALDRYYLAEDGAVWLSFPSSERNKVAEGQYIVLKKEHDSDIPIVVNNKYKVLSVSNEAPDFITEIGEVVGNVLSYAWMPSGDEGFIIGNKSIKFWSEVRDSNPPYYDGFKKGETIYFETEGRGARSEEYIIHSGGPVGSASTASPATFNGKEYVEYEILLKDAIRASDAWLVNLPDQEPFYVVLENKTIKSSPEFVGRFFAKITPNATFFDGIPDEFKSEVVNYVEDKRLQVSTIPSVTPPFYTSEFVWLDEYQFPSYPNTPLPPTPNTNGNGGLAPNQNYFNIYYTLSSPSNTFLHSFWDSLATPGTKIKFTDATGTIISDDYYTIVKVADNSGSYGDYDVYARYDSTGTAILGSNGRYMQVTLDRAWDDLPAAYSAAGIVIYREEILTGTTLLSSTNPAIFETVPEELADLDIYWEASDLIDVSNAGQRNFYLNWYNCYSFGNGVESDRIRDDFNTPTIGKGVRVNAELQEPYREERRKAGLIYSGIYNNLSSTNETNQFIAGLKITKDLDPVYGGIQKLFARDTNLLAFAEDKVYAVLADKDALFNADGNTNLLSTNRVLGNASTFAGEFGISKNPESFASYGFRVYFTDKARGAVLRLSNDGITEISEKGMTDFFVDAFAVNTTPVIGSFDESTSAYNIKLNNESISFKERVDGWPTRLSFDPEFAVSLNNEYYTFKNGEIWEHSNQTRNNFYGAQESSQVTVVFNDAPSSIKNFKTLSYEGTERWTAAIATDKQNGTVSAWRDNEGIYHNFIKGENLSLAVVNGQLNSKDFSVQGIGEITAHTPGVPYTIEVGGNVNTSLSVNDTLYIKRGTAVLAAGPVTNTVSNRVEFTDSGVAPITGEYAFFLKSNAINTSGLLGYYANVTFTNTDTDFAELFAINSEVFISSE